jgi:hypothetical protein
VRNLPTFWGGSVLLLISGHIRGISCPEDEGSIFLPAIRYLLLFYTVFRPRHFRKKVENPYENVLYTVP